jgi:hypothetical protein
VLERISLTLIGARIHSSLLLPARLAAWRIGPVRRSGDAAFVSVAIDVRHLQVYVESNLGEDHPWLGKGIAVLLAAWPASSIRGGKRRQELDGEALTRSAVLH